MDKLTPELVNFHLPLLISTERLHVYTDLLDLPKLMSPFYPMDFQTRSPSKAAGMFSGTQEKCATCGKTAYPLEKVFSYTL